MHVTIKSKCYGELTFSRPGSHYIYCDMGVARDHGTLGQQICKGGGLTGSTIMYTGDDEQELRKICRNWLRARARSEDK
jgi:hypothetical protein